MVSLGNLLYSKGFTFLGNIFDLVGLFFMFLIMLKLIFTMRHLLEALKDPIVGSVSPTFTMAWMVICVFLNRIFPHSSLVYFIWLCAIFLHFLLMAYFVALHILPQKVGMGHVYPSWFITFVGLGVIPNTATVFNIEIGRSGRICFGLRFSSILYCSRLSHIVSLFSRKCMSRLFRSSPFLQRQALSV